MQSFRRCPQILRSLLWGLCIIINKTLTALRVLVFIRAERFTTQGTCKKEDPKSLFQSCPRWRLFIFSVTMKFFSSLALENQFGIFLNWKLIFTAFLLFVSTFKPLLICMSSLFYRLPSIGVYKHYQKIYHNATRIIMHHASVSWEQPQLK